MGPRLSARAAVVAWPLVGRGIGAQQERQKVVDEGRLARAGRPVDEQRALQPATARRAQCNGARSRLAHAQESRLEVAFNHETEYRWHGAGTPTTAAEPGMDRRVAYFVHPISARVSRR